MFRFILAAAVPLSLAGCAATREPVDILPVQSPADLNQGIRNVSPPTALGGYTHRTPVGPKPWRQQNDRQAPGAGVGS